MKLTTLAIAISYFYSVWAFCSHLSHFTPSIGVLSTYLVDYLPSFLSASHADCYNYFALACELGKLPVSGLSPDGDDIPCYSKASDEPTFPFILKQYTARMPFDNGSWLATEFLVASLSPHSM